MIISFVYMVNSSELAVTSQERYCSYKYFYENVSVVLCGDCQKPDSC